MILKFCDHTTFNVFVVVVFLKQSFLFKAIHIFMKHNSGLLLVKIFYLCCNISQVVVTRVSCFFYQHCHVFFYQDCHVENK